MGCQNLGGFIAKAGEPKGKIEGKGMLSDIEERAVVDARQQLFEALVRQKLDAHFENCSEAQIDDIIKSVVIGFQVSIQKAYGRGEVPFFGSGER